MNNIVQKTKRVRDVRLKKNIYQMHCEHTDSKVLTLMKVITFRECAHIGRKEKIVQTQNKIIKPQKH